VHRLMAVSAPRRRITRRRRRLTLPPGQSQAPQPGSAAGAPTPSRGGGGGSGGGGGGSPSGPVLTLEMVDRLFWRAGFGPSQNDRDTWSGRTVSEAVDWLLDTPQGAPVGAQATLSGQPIDRLAGVTEVVLEWVGRMVSARNPLVERLTFFWHRHWACSLDSVDLLFMVQQNDLFRRYADLGANPSADFRNLAYEVSEGPAMLRYLSGELNRRGRPNENYARELMELFCLGVTDTGGNPNYTETDVRELARALSGWTINTTDPNNPRGVFNTSRFDNLPKTFLGSTGNFSSRQAVDIVLARPQHASYIVRKLWSEFIVGPPDGTTLADLTATYTGTGLGIKPLLRKILTHPQLFDSPAEPTLIKPPIVYVAGGFRQVGLNVINSTPYSRLAEMGQVPFFPPNVSGWEYGSAFLTTNAVLNRWGFGSDIVSRLNPADVVGETPQAAFDRAFATSGRPWLSPATRAAMLDYATRAPVSNSSARQARQRVLLAMALAGPDTHVM
jgi:hypothetical protein